MGRTDECIQSAEGKSGAASPSIVGSGPRSSRNSISSDSPPMNPEYTAGAPFSSRLGQVSKRVSVKLAKILCTGLPLPLRTLCDDHTCSQTRETRPVRVHRLGFLSKAWTEGALSLRYGSVAIWIRGCVLGVDPWPC
jgi:hypothetical protein